MICMIKLTLTRLKVVKVGYNHAQLTVRYGKKIILPHHSQSGMSDLIDHWLQRLSETVIWRAH